MLSDCFDYQLPEKFIARFPPEKRGDSRMLVLRRNSGNCEVRRFEDITAFLNAGDCIVVNNTKVIKARLFGRKNGNGARIEILLIRHISAGKWTAFLRPGKRVKNGTPVRLTGPKGAQEYWVKILERTPDGAFTVDFENANFAEIINFFGHVPLPHYIGRDDEKSDEDRYQTVFAKEEGAVAAPTAGLHFTEEIFAKFAEKGIKTAELTLHIGPGTFQPVSTENIEGHKMHSELFFLPSSSSEIINETKKNGGKILAVGTTSVRVLESCANEDGTVRAARGETNIFLYPPYSPKVPDMLLTNFHLPKSTLLMLVATFAKLEYVLNAYELAKRENFRFYSYGDCMLLA